jgi:hypothetical protein
MPRLELEKPFWASTVGFNVCLRWQSDSAFTAVPFHLLAARYMSAYRVLHWYVITEDTLILDTEPILPYADSYAMLQTPITPSIHQIGLFDYQKHCPMHVYFSRCWGDGWCSQRRVVAPVCR